MSIQILKKLLPLNVFGLSLLNRKWKSLKSCLTLCDPMDYTYSPWNSPGQNTREGSLSLLQGSFPTQRSNSGLPYCRRILYNWTIREAQKGNYSAIKKEWNNVICSNTDETRDYHIKWSKSEGERLIPYDITYMWNLKYDINELITQTETDSQIKRTVLGLPRGWVGRGGWTGSLGLTCKPLYIE